MNEIEAGQRKVTAEELTKFSVLYGVSTEELVHGKLTENVETEMFARAFSELSETDKREIMGQINFKRRYKETLNV